MKKERAKVLTRKLVTFIACCALALALAPATAFATPAATSSTSVTVYGLASPTAGTTITWPTSDSVAGVVHPVDGGCMLKDAKWYEGTDTSVDPIVSGSGIKFETGKTYTLVMLFLNAKVVSGSDYTGWTFNADYDPDSFTIEKVGTYGVRVEATYIVPADMSSVESILPSSWLGESEGQSPSALYMGTSYDSEYGYYFEFKLQSSYPKDTCYAYDAVTCKQLKNKITVSGYAHVSVTDLISNSASTTAKILVTGTELTAAQIKSLGTLPDSKLSFLTLPSYKDLGDYYYNEGDDWGEHTYNVTAEQVSCNKLRLWFAIDSNDDVDWAIFVDGKKIRTGGTKNYNQSYTFGNYLPGSSHNVVFKVYTVYQSVLLTNTYSKTMKTMSFAKPTASATKLSKSKASIKVTVPAAEAGKGLTRIKLYCGKKLVKSFKTNGKTTYYITYAKKGATTGKYVAKASWVAKSSIKANSKAVKAKANVVKFNSSVSPSSYSQYSQYFVTKNMSYSGKYLVIKGWFLNTHIYSTKVKTEITVYVNGKKITGVKTLTSKRLGQNGKQAVTIKIKAKKIADLRNYSVTVNHPTYEVS